MSPAHGRPPSKDPKEHQKRIRMSDEDIRILEYCCQMTGKTQSDVIREGIREVYAKLKKIKEIGHFGERRVVAVLGGRDSNAYHDKSLSQKIFMDAYRNLKSNFDVSSYKAIKRNRKDVAVQIAREYKPPLYLAEQIQEENNQMSLF